MKHKLVIVLLLAMLGSGLTGSVCAANPKKKKKVARSEATTDQAATRREERKKARLERRRQRQERKLARFNKNNPPAPAPKIKVFKYPATVKKDRYRIDIFAAIYLDELVTGKSASSKDRIPDKAVAGVSFYEGVSIAADSLKRAGFDIDIYVHDAMSKAESPEAMIAAGSLDSTDLIIAALQPEYLPALADYAKKMKVNFVSANVPVDAGIKNNKYFTILHPTLKSHCEYIAADVKKKFPGMKVSMLFRTSVPADEQAFRYFAPSGKSSFRSLLCNSLPDKKEMIAMFDTTRPNIVIIPVVDPVYADSLLKVLSRSFPSTHFEVYGMPTWKKIAGLRKDDAFPNLSVNLTTAFNIDATNPYVRYISFVYKNAYGGKATESVLHGYETIFWYANLLKANGTIFNAAYKDNSTAPFTKFEIKQQWDDDGGILYNENKHLYISKYEGGAFQTE